MTVQNENAGITAAGMRSLPTWVWWAGGIVVAVIITVIVVISLPKGPTPSGLAQDFLEAVATGDEAKVVDLLGPDADAEMVAAAQHLDAVATPIADITVEQVDDWDDAGERRREQQVVFSFILDGEKYEGELAASINADGHAGVYVPLILGGVEMPEVSGYTARIKGVDDESFVKLFPGVYSVAGEDADFPYVLSTSSVSVIPGETVDVAYEEDLPALSALIRGLDEEVKSRANVVAGEALGDGSIPTGDLHRFGHDPRNISLVDLTVDEHGAFRDGEIFWTYNAHYKGEQYWGALSAEWVPIEATVPVTVSVLVDEEGSAGNPMITLDTTDLVWDTKFSLADPQAG